MAGKSHSAQKRHRQSEERRIRNKAVKSSVRTSVRKFTEQVVGGKKDEAASALKEMVKRIDTAARKGIVNKKAAARKKSRMQKRYNAMSAG
ncbi:MAG: 30S ribosomal protein S20 [Spirochaetaceae bacterium]|nr:30S ribosomal protein S20 [Spirochaetaceae bacterium]